MQPLHIAENIKQAYTLPATFYRDPAYFEASKDKIFARTWQLVADTDQLKTPSQVLPFFFLESFIDEPLLFTRDTQDQIHCLSNVCTHRGNLVVEQAGKCKELRCRYHGRRFGLDGQFVSMPEFKEVENFPTEADHLHRVPFGQWGKFLFASLDPAMPLSDVINTMQQRLSWMPFDSFLYDPARSRDYLVKAHWALYCDNYLEGFHIPFIHPSLNSVLNYDEYAYELYQYANLQIGYAKGADFAFDLPPESPDYGQRIAAYYYWVFPNMMFNFYPWGCSVNIVKPLAPDLTKVSFLTYAMDSTRMTGNTIPLIDRTEREDEEVVEAVQRGVRSRFYKAGRYSPNTEQGVHHFHRLVQTFLQ
ncbi:MAG TPA: choline monooxygenase [Microscillaceae bacterium]|jgi:choline monooxygenase|nr:choline monooxygenase [Microscillaceae bacterium]